MVCHFPSPRDLLDPGIKLESPALAGGFFTAELPGKPMNPSSGLFQSWLEIKVVCGGVYSPLWESNFSLESKWSF